MLNAYILLYQYFDLQEIKLVNEIETLQERVLYRDPREFTEEETQQLLYAKIKLNFVRKIASELLQMFYTL